MCSTAKPICRAVRGSIPRHPRQPLVINGKQKGMEMKTLLKEYVWPLLWLLVAMLILGAALAFSIPPKAQAEDGIGCETILWGFLGSQRRTLCDGPIQADGSWVRVRVIWWPERWVPVSCSRYSCWGGYWIEEGGNREAYIVRPETVLPDEPGHLQP